MIELKKCHSPKIVCVKMIDIDDMRDDFGTMHLQPNFDIMYSILIGDIISRNS